MNVMNLLKRMRVISPAVHGMLDYPTAGALMAAPNLFGFADRGGPAEIVPRVAGAMVLGQAAVTDYKMGLVKRLPMQAHLAIDMVMGPLLAVSPFLFGFKGRKTSHWLPHVLVGSFITLSALMTRSQSRRQMEQGYITEEPREVKFPAASRVHDFESRQPTR